MTIALSLLSTWFLTFQFSGGSFDPDLKWRTIETPHFYIHYPSELDSVAQNVAARAEPTFEERTKGLQWTPSGKIHVVLADSTDAPNGLSTPLPYNMIILWPTPPLDGTPLDEYDDWIHTLFAHEFTHTVHLDMAEGFNKFMRRILGRTWIPNAPQQQWAHEGLAIFYETKDTTRGRGRSAYLNMILRTQSLENKFADISQATYWNDIYPFGNTAYWYGAGFHNYLAETYGEEKIVKVLHETASFPLPIGFQNFKSDDTFHKSFSRMWHEWKLSQDKKWAAFAAENPNRQTYTEPNSEKPILMTGRPFYDASSKSFYVPTRSDNNLNIRRFWFDENNQLKNEVVKKGSSNSLFVHDGFLIYSDQAGVRGYDSYFDIHLYNLKDETEKRVTIGARLRDPIVVGNTLYAIHTDALKTSIVSFPFSQIVEAFNNDKPLRFPKGTSIFEAKNYDSIGKLAASPDGREIAFSMKVEDANRDLYSINLETKKVSQITNDSADDYFPLYISNDEIIFESAHFLGNSKIEVPNIFIVNTKTNEIRQVTTAVTGATWPTVGGNQLLLGIFHSDGWHVATTPYGDISYPVYAGGNRVDPSPKKFDDSKKYESTSYRMGDSLLPRFIAPLWFFTEHDQLIGVQTGSRDPLGRHTWGAIGYALIGPNRPGGSLQYAYFGIRNTTLFAIGYSGITNYGQMMFISTPTLAFSSQNYYERLWGATAGVSYRFTGDEGPSNWSTSLAGFYELRQPLLPRPAGLFTGPISVTNTVATITNTKSFPETGPQWGGRASLNWASEFEMDLDGISPKAGKSAGLSLEYSPKKWGSKFHQLTTILSGKAYFETFKNQAIALKGVAGLQWLDPLYQRTFLLGGSIGDLNPFANVNRRNYPFRGLPSSNLRGEGMLFASLEYRLPMVRHMKGFGTAPLWIKNLHAAWFSDAGQTFQRRNDNTAIEALSDSTTVKKFDYRRFSLSTGAELRSDISVSYAPPLQYRIGYGYVVFRQGQRPTRRLDEVYFQIGSSF